METKTIYQIGKYYFAIFGLIVLGIGIIELIIALTGGCVEYGAVIICDQEDFLLWRGLILFFAGAFYLSSFKNFTDIHQQAKTIMASVMIWLIGGIAFLGMILGSIPGPEDGAWFNTAEGFIASYAGPYIPSLLLLPFSLVAIYYLYLDKKNKNIADEGKINE
jgi:hypothetical protein